MTSTAPLLTYGEAAQHLGVSEKTISRLVRDGRLPYVQLGVGGTKSRRVRITDLDEYVANSVRVEPSAS